MIHSGNIISAHTRTSTIFSRRPGTDAILSTEMIKFGPVQEKLSTSKVMDQPKIERLLRLMKYLSGNVNYSIGELADRLGMSPRTVYRYIDTLRSAGFAVNKLSGDIYKLCRLPKDAVEIDKLVYFSEEEAYLVNSLIDRLAPTNSLKANLRQKLSAIYRSTGIADFADSRGSAAIVESLGRAVEQRRKAILKDYESGNSHTIRDRRIEPFAFTADYADIWGYDLEDSRNKTFKISRISDVLVLDEEWTCGAEHHKSPTDIFRMTSDHTVHVRLRLSLYAKNLLVEEYPLAARDLEPDSGGAWILDTEVCGMQGAGRFVCGLAREVEIVEGDALRDYVRGCAGLLQKI